MSNYITIPLSKTSKTQSGKFETKVSIEDIELGNTSWNLSKCNNSLYAKRTVKSGKKSTKEYLHRVIMQRILGRPLAKGELVDHANMDTLDNRRENLRLANQSQNQSNRGKPVTNTSGYKGVWWNKRNQKWVAEIRVNGKKNYIGSFVNPEDAHEAYKEKAIEIHGEFARFD